jgi:hypothetical protein
MKLRKQSKQLSSKPPAQPQKKSVPRASPTGRDPPISVHKRSPEVDQTINSLVYAFTFRSFWILIFVNILMMCLLSGTVFTEVLSAKLTEVTIM